ncbi:hypothetical protein [Streptomyces microflavus]|uniref:hypothetical protein n=1 Tax=Streptomyces microflavus TaxID=1919 RepID=UPI00386D42B5|nr:hypothetical protein OG269_21965 [Streptomyces microflavus]WST19767.1 hypothetical protein OG721_16815 [Streptomyces microflavus]
MPLSAAAAMAAAMTVLVAAVVPGAAASAGTSPETPTSGAPTSGVPASEAPVGEVVGAVPLPEADLSHHGYVSFSGGHIAIRIRSENLGPSDVTASTVRLRFSAPLAVTQELPYGCLRSGKATVLCETGGLRSGGGARQTALDLRLAGGPDEVIVRLDTVWNGGVRDKDPKNNVHQVLAPATGDAYAF